MNEHPARSWKQMAEALYRSNLRKECLKELEVVQKEYLRGESAVVIVTYHTSKNSALLIIQHPWTRLGHLFSNFWRRSSSPLS